jgi:hypothetical protein
MTLQTELDALPRKLPRRNEDLDRVVRRYTTLTSALDVLTKKRLVLGNPSKWDDTNDSYFLELYEIETKTPAVVAICCTRAVETYHHWRVFTPASEGICIEFNRELLEAALKRKPNIAVAAIEYLKLNELTEFSAADVPRLPFAKRLGYRDEREWRIVGICDDPTAQSLAVPINLSWISRIVLNPWMPQALADSLRTTIRGFDGCAKIRIEISRLTNSERWKSAGKSICVNLP